MSTTNATPTDPTKTTQTTQGREGRRALLVPENGSPSDIVLLFLGHDN